MNKIEFTSETTATITTEKYQFFLDAGEAGLPEHGQMIKDFKDEGKLNYFCELLNSNPSTAFKKYVTPNKLY